MKNLEMEIRESITPEEESRLENLKKYKIAYNKSESVFDELAAFAATMMDTPIAVINFVDKESVWTNAVQDVLPVSEFQGETCLCALAIINEFATAYENMLTKPCLMSNALVAGEMGMKFYAAAPIVNDEGLNVGSVCILDQKHRTFLTHEQKKLELIAVMIRKEMNKRIAKKHIQEHKDQLFL